MDCCRRRGLRGSGVALEPVQFLEPGCNAGFDTPGRITVQLRALLRGASPQAETPLFDLLHQRRRRRPVTTQFSRKHAEIVVIAQNGGEPVRLPTQPFGVEAEYGAQELELIQKILGLLSTLVQRRSSLDFAFARALRPAR